MTLAAALRVAEGSEVVAVERLRFADDEPIALLHNHLPAGTVELTARSLSESGLYQLLRRSGIGPEHRRRRPSAPAGPPPPRPGCCTRPAGRPC